MDDYMAQALNTFWVGASRKARSEPSLNDPMLTESQSSTITMRSLDNAFKTFINGLHHLYSVEACQHNTLLPISRFPNDLLVEIFALASEMDVSVTGWDYSPQQRGISLADLTLVCRKWRAIVCNTPSLWAYISSAHPHRATLECLARSDQALLRIFLNYCSLNYGNAGDLNTRILEEGHRWKTVELHNVEMDMLKKLEQRAAPLLERFLARADAGMVHDTVNLFGGSASRLRHLTLINIRIPWDSGLLLRLRTLYIDCHQGDNPSAQQVVHALQSCPDLTRFRLNLSPKVHPGPIPPETFPIELPRLEYLDISVHPLMTEHLLRRMRIPSCKRFSVEDVEATGPTFSATMAHLNPSLSSILRAAKDVSINIDGNSLDYKATTTVEGVWYKGEVDDLAQYIHIRASGNRFTGDFVLDTLSWLLDNVHTPSFISPVYLHIFNIPSSHTLMVIINRLSSVITNLHLALSSASAETIISYLAEPFKVITDGTTTLRWPLPNLTELYCYGCVDIEPEVVLACIQRRAGRGLFPQGSREHREELPTRLMKLHLRLPRRSSSTDIMKMFPDCEEWCGLELEHEHGFGDYSGCTPNWGRTPNPYASGPRTPRTNNARTPNPYASGGRTPAWGNSSRTPNPYASGARTPNPYVSSNSTQ
ncbi:hypothetical protein FRB93_004459 [Tulasnella sp. JGI-2019a]|nr:hypothetical protein FRB93_004459 [Tulasnella sp. JGI-2019a]